ncbi:hypothetical protein ACFL5O_03445 [Myxococcota bacterium]
MGQLGAVLLMTALAVMPAASCTKKQKAKPDAAKAFAYDIRGDYLGAGTGRNGVLKIRLLTDEDYRISQVEWDDLNAKHQEIDIAWSAPNHVKYTRRKEQDVGGDEGWVTQTEKKVRNGDKLSVTFKHDYEQASVRFLKVSNYRYQKSAVEDDHDNTGNFEKVGECLVGKIKAFIPQEERKQKMSSDDVRVDVGSIHAMKLVHDQARNDIRYKNIREWGGTIESIDITDTSFGVGAAGVSVKMNHMNGSTRYTRGTLETTSETFYEVGILKRGEWKIEAHFCPGGEMFVLNKDRRVGKGRDNPYVRYELRKSE